MGIDSMRLARYTSSKNLRSLAPVPIALEGIPDEIVEHFLSSCGTRDLLAVTLTCRRLSRVATGVLYRDVKLLSSRKATRFFLTIYHKENIGLWVRSCEIAFTFNQRFLDNPRAQGLSSQDSKFSRVWKFIPIKNEQPETHMEQIRDPLQLASAALERLPRLNYLELLLPEREVHNDFIGRLFGRVTFQLNRFHTNLRFDSAMAAFLKTQHKLEDFRFYSSTPFSALDISMLTNDMLPHLTSLSWSNRVPMDLVRWLVKGRPIETVNIFHLGGIYDISHLLAIGPSSDRIKIANLTFQDRRQPTVSQLEAINIHFPNLVNLGVNIVSLTQEVISDLCRAILQFKRLERLYICDQENKLSLDQSTILYYAELFWTRCPCLRRIGFYICDPYLMVERIVRILEPAGRRRCYGLYDPSYRTSLAQPALPASSENEEEIYLATESIQVTS
ncbi:hypothetical protein BDN70DRAFT_873499 [Pholiota conissans]|uniref:F-box domain-containing protein n=1 Tax=Pholiota conissans TaxID=109636 RepID=A0A9P5ZBG5_9AGAR|nr:hypothetical protein BDN70DRAFT_873499 [Pholiota conissans]